MMPEFLLRHTVIRRVCTCTVLAILCAAVFALLPLAALLDALSLLIHGRKSGHTRTARFAAFAGTYLAAEVIGLSGALRLRRSEPEPHYALLRRLLSMLFRTSQRTFRLRIAAPEEGLALPEGPLLVFSRHAGPGDSFLLAYGLLATGRRPRIVAKQTLRLDPFIDVLLGRLPNCFVGSGEPARAEATRCITELAASLGPHDALLVFPEGGNFTANRRGRLIRRLRRRRDRSALSVAESLDHVLPPHPSGVFAAIDAAPATASIVFVAHTGLDHLETVAETWRAVPLEEPLHLTWWTVPAPQVPAEEDARQAWLHEQWARIDTWLDDHRPEPARPQTFRPATTWPHE